MIAQLDKDYIKIRPHKVLNRLISYSLFEGRPLLTSGRWINPIVFSLMSMEKKLPQLKKVEKPVFILGTGRSGTTLLGVLLSMHRNVSFLNEPKAIWHSIFPHEDIIGNYTNSPAFYRLSSDMVTSEIIIHAHKIYGFYLRLLGTQRVVDKYPELIFRTSFVQTIFPDAKFILIVRNGYDTCVSIEQWSKKNGQTNSLNERDDWWGKSRRKWNLLMDQVVKADPEFEHHYEEINAIQDPRNMALVEWCLTMKEGVNLMREKIADIHLVKFESLSHSPEKTLQSILKFLDLPEDQQVIEYARKVVRPVESKDKFEIHPRLVPSFVDLMRYFNYDV